MTQEEKCDRVRRVFKHSLHGGKNPILPIPAHWAEARGAEVCAEHLDTQPETLPVLSGSPTRRWRGQRGKGQKEGRGD